MPLREVADLMADLSDVMTVLVNLAQTAVYPNGTNSPSVAGIDVRIFSGWPIPANLDSDLKAGKANVSVYPTSMERNTTRFETNWQISTVNASTLTLTVSNSNILTVGGTVSVPQTCMVIVNGTGYAYAVQANDTLNTIASGISALIAGSSATGAVVTIPSAHILTANLSVTGTSIKEVKRQERVFATTVWAPTDAIRTSLASAIDILFAATIRIILPDNFYAHIKYHASHQTDIVEKYVCYKRDLMYAIDYATTQTELDYTIADSYMNSIDIGPTGQINP
jgi:hypothetical protein